ncbi:YbjN domain-containing protein [Corynebacterium sp. YIM 101645]|uniref:YbjN domain-containing protein n=1 Tax=Corynebacterium lemuris TaxID=1859292 RepID=A0ABT2FWG2_9CORY|nr:YbjN domain-containing protein [Corynebacterium lemuris]MCS5479578.1 YbjN domain-containing protein [Corynebacterium lemuris]
MSSSELSTVSIDRVIDTMQGFDVELERMGDNDVATANLNDLPVTFAVLGSVFIVRADTVTEQTLNDADPTLYLAANQINSVGLGARATIVDRAEQLIVRTERDVAIAAGMNDDQLSASLRSAVDAVLATQDAMTAAAGELAELRAKMEQELGDQA